MASSKLDTWVATMIDGCRLGTVPKVAAAEEQLIEAIAFFEGRRSTIFGMDATVARLEDAAALRARAVDALRAFFDAEAATGRLRGCDVLLDRAKRRGVALDFELPAALRARAEIERRHRHELAALPSPLATLETVAPGLHDTVRELGGDLDASHLREHGRLLTHPHDVALTDFAWLDWHDEDDWFGWPAAATDPVVFALGQGGGAVLGLLVDARSPNVAPAVVCETADSCVWIAEGLPWLDDMVRAAVRNRGKHRAPKVEAARGARGANVEDVLDPTRRSARIAAGREVVAAATEAERDAALEQLLASFPEASHALARTSLRARWLRAAAG
jgi:hypothetical protein